MKLRTLATLIATIGLAATAEAATLVSALNINRNGGTATGSFVNNELPGFVLTASQGRISIRSNSSNPAFQWQFLLNGNGETPLRTAPTIDLTESLTFSGGPVRIFENAIPLSADRFNPDPVYFLIGKVNGSFHAFEVARWASGPTDRLRFYGVQDVTFIDSNAVIPVPEPGAAAIGLLGTALLLIRRRP